MIYSIVGCFCAEIVSRDTFKMIRIKMINLVGGGEGVVQLRNNSWTKLRFRKTVDQTIIDNYRLAANIAEYHIISKLILQRIIILTFMMISQLFRVKIFQLKEKN